MLYVMSNQMGGLTRCNADITSGSHGTFLVLSNLVETKDIRAQPIA
jgi:hypothetical protein